MGGICRPRAADISLARRQKPSLVCVGAAKDASMMAFVKSISWRMDKALADKILTDVNRTYDAIAPAFAATRQEPWGELERVRDFVKNGSAVLDVGCGNGRAYQLFSGLAIEYEGVDVSEALLAEARRAIRDQLAVFRHGSMLSLPGDDGRFDLVLAIAVLHHVPSRA